MKQKHEVYARGQAVSLTFKEFELLSYLMKNRGLVLSRDKILNTIWNYEYEGESRTVDVHIWFPCDRNLGHAEIL